MTRLACPRYLSIGLFLLLVWSCGPAARPEIVAIQYLRASHTGQADTTLGLLDLDEVLERVEDQIVLVQPDGASNAFMVDSITTVLWGLFQQAQQREYAYDAAPAEIDGDRAIAVVTLTNRNSESRRQTVHLRRTDDGWRISGPSLDPLVRYVIQRLDERY